MRYPTNNKADLIIGLSPLYRTGMALLLVLCQWQLFRLLFSRRTKRKLINRKAN
jgi:hypothetical protein